MFIALYYIDFLMVKYSTTQTRAILQIAVFHFLNHFTFTLLYFLQIVIKKTLQQMKRSKNMHDGYDERFGWGVRILNVFVLKT